MQIRKRVMAVLCAAVLLIGLIVSAAAALDDIYFLSINDTLSPLTADLMPIRANNTVYIPSSVFNRNLTGISLGVFYGQDKAKGTATLYSRQKTLIFDINAGYAYDSSDGKTYNYRVIIRNGRTYLPAYSVCQFFGLEYSALSTDYGPLIRLKSEKVWLTDAVFISSAASLMSSRLNEYQQANQASHASPSATLPINGSSDSDRSNVRVYLAMRVDSGQSLEEILDILSEESVPVLFFFRTSELAEYDTLIRRIVGSGCQLGLLVDGGTADEMERQLAEGNRLLEHIVRQRAYTVLVDGTDSQRTELDERGVACWQENVDGHSYGRGSTALVSSVMGEVNAKKTFARVLLDDGISSSALSKLIRQLKVAKYNIRLAVETVL